MRRIKYVIALVKIQALFYSFHAIVDLICAIFYTIVINELTQIGLVNRNYEK